MRERTAVIFLVAVMAVAEDPTLPDIWRVVEDSYDSTLTINFPDLVSLKCDGVAGGGVAGTKGEEGENGKGGKERKGKVRDEP